MVKIMKEMIVWIFVYVGGVVNVVQVGNCMMCLCLILCDESLVDSVVICQIDGVMGVIVSDEQFQVVFGFGKV